MKKIRFIKSLILTVLVVTLTSVNTVVNAQNIGDIKGIIAESAIVMDMDTGEVIASKNADEKMPMASTIKLLTSLIYAENTSKSEMISFTEDALKTKITSLNNFKEINVGDKISSNDLMKAVMILSANDAAYLMADSVAGNTKDFVKMMNDRVKSLGLKDTTIVNPCGLESDAINPDNKEINISTAYDMAVIASEAYKNEWIREIVSDKYKNTSIDLSGTPIIIETRNKILNQNGNIGGKTGNETKAGHCFVGFFERDGKNLVTVALKSQYGVDGTNVFNDTNTIANTGYDAKKQVYKKANEELQSIELEYKAFGFFGPKKTIKAPIIAQEDITYYKNNINDKNIKVEYNSEDKSAWKLAGDEVNMTLSMPNYKSEIVGKVDISILDLIKSNILVYTIAILCILLVLALIGFIMKFINSKKRKSTRSIMGKKKKYKMYIK